MVVSGLVIALLCRGDVLLEGVPGVAKTSNTYGYCYIIRHTRHSNTLLFSLSIFYP